VGPTITLKDSTAICTGFFHLKIIMNWHFINLSTVGIRLSFLLVYSSKTE